MSNPFLTFLAGRKTKQPEHIANESQPVTRKEFAVVAAAVQALIEDFDTVTAPDKLKAVVNSAFQDVTNAAPAKPDGERGTMPPRVSVPIVRTNAKATARPPLALKGD